MKIIIHDLNKLWFDILLHTQSIVCVTVDSQCLDYMGYITLFRPQSYRKMAELYTSLMFFTSLVLRCNDLQSRVLPQKTCFLLPYTIVKKSFWISILAYLCYFDDVLFGHYVVLYVASSPGCSIVLTWSQEWFQKNLLSVAIHNWVKTRLNSC